MRELTGPERQHRYFKAKAIKFNRKIDRLREKAMDPKVHSQLMVEGQALLLFTTLDAMSRGSSKCGN